jgi:hypothetical protein
VVNNVLFSFALMSILPTVFAYLGPGMSGGAIAAILGFFAAIFLGLFGILYYPIKRAWKNRKVRKQEEDEGVSD